MNDLRIEVNFDITEELLAEVVTAQTKILNDALSERRSNARSTLYWTILFLVLIGAFQWIESDIGFGIVFGAILTAILMFVRSKFLYLRCIKVTVSMWLRCEKKKGRVAVTFDRTGMALSNTLERSFYDWRGVEDIRETKSAVLMHLGNKLAAIPISSLPVELSASDFCTQLQGWRAAR